MTWSVVTGDDAWADLERLSQAQRLVLSALLVEWVESGPPRSNRRDLLGVANIFDDEVMPGVAVTYFADDGSEIVGVLRVRKR